MELPQISLCIIVKNEENDLARCLESVQGVVDEIVLVDTGSADRTLEIAARFGARIFHHAWQSDFSQARNAALEQARGEWILHLDADEELEAESRGKLLPFLAGTNADCLTLCVRSFSPPGAVTRQFDSQQARLFRNRPEHRYEQSIHEQIVYSIQRHGGKVEPADLLIYHYGYIRPTVQGGSDRVQRNFALLQQAVASDPMNPYLCARLGFEYYQLGDEHAAYDHLRRVLMELDTHKMDFATLDRVLLVLGELAMRHEEYSLASKCARASLEINGPNPVSTLSLNARACQRLGESLWKQTGLSTGRTRTEARDGARNAILEAVEAYQELKERPDLNPELIEQINFEIDSCQHILAAILNYQARVVREKEMDELSADTESLMAEGEACFQKGDYAAAQAAFDRLVQLAPQHLWPRQRLTEAIRQGAPRRRWEVPVVSAIVSTYNSEQFIRGCLQDLVDQTLYQSGGLEIIVVNAASQQGEGEIVQAFQRSYDRVVYIEAPEREGIYASWNRGIRAARGRYLTNANTDDRHRIDALERLAAVLDARPDVALVYADVLITPNPNEAFPTAQPSGVYRWREFDPDTLLSGCYMGPQPVWRKSLHDSYGWFNAGYRSAGDYEFWLRLSRQEKFLHVPEVLGLYYKNEQGMELSNRGRSGNEARTALARHTPKDRAMPELGFDWEQENRLGDTFGAGIQEQPPVFAPSNALELVQQLRVWADQLHDQEDIAGAMLCYAWLCSQPVSRQPARPAPATGILPNRAVETLKLLLDADDLAGALQQYEDRLDHDLLAVIQRNLDAARQNGDLELAEGLADLSAYVESVLESLPA